MGVEYSQSYPQTTGAFMSGFKPGLLPTLVVLALLPVLVWLGFWQLERGEQKRDMLERQEARAELGPLSPAELEELTDPAYSRVYLQGRFDAEHSFLLDSRTRDGQVGVELLQPFQDQPSGRWVIVNRGWIPWPDRRIAPQFDTPEQELKLAAWTYVPSGKPFVLDRGMAEGWPRLINHVDMQQLWQALGREGVAYELRLEPGPAAYRADWPVTSMSPAQHRGYAAQWFALAAALLALFIYLGVHQARESRHGEHESDRR
jgi:surfeit locus 1 family protein